MSFIKEPPISQRHGLISPLAEGVNLDNLKKMTSNVRLFLDVFVTELIKDTIDQRFLKHH